MQVGVRSRVGALGCACLLLLGSCATRLPSAPQPTSVTPSQGTNDVDVAITIAGDGLQPRLTTDFNDHNKSGFSDAFTARLGDIDLTNVEPIAGGGLRALVPKGMAPGKYELTVVDPYGRKGVLESAFEVTKRVVVVPTLLAFATPSQSVRQNICSGPVIVQTQDSSGNELPTPNTLRVDLGSDLQLFSDGACKQPITQRDISAGQSRTSAVFFIGPSPGSHVIVANAQGLIGVTQTEAILALFACPGGVADGEPCDDGNACTLNDTCSGGLCVSDGMVTCTALDDCHDIGVCDSMTGVCTNPLKPDGESCSDGIACTTGETCHDGICAMPTSFSGCANTPPIACFTVTPVAALSGVARTFSANCSTDVEDAPGTLQARFDFDGDDVFDTPFSTQPQSFNYPTPGLFTATVEVRDDAGVSSFQRRLVAATSAANDVLVTTALPESDSNATPTTPGGTGLSLREAVAYANLTGGKVIHFDGGMSLQLNAALTLTGSDISIIGEPGTSVDLSTISGLGNSPCISVEGANDRLVGLRLFGCARAPAELKGTGAQLAWSDVRGSKSVLVSGANAIVGPGNDLHDFTGTEALRISSSGVTVDGNRIHDSAGQGIYADGSATSLTVQRNSLYRNGSSAISFASGANGPLVQFNTIALNSGDGVQTTAVLAPPLTVLNNVFGWNRAGVNVPKASMVTVSPNLFFANINGGTVDAGVFADPLLLNPDGGDFRPRTESPAVNAGVDVGVDVNGPTGGRFNGTAPDLGSYETP